MIQILSIKVRVEGKSKGALRKGVKGKGREGHLGTENGEERVGTCDVNVKGTNRERTIHEG